MPMCNYLYMYMFYGCNAYMSVCVHVCVYLLCKSACVSIDKSTACVCNMCMEGVHPEGYKAIIRKRPKVTTSMKKTL